jgi:succinyl-CoA synthetase alpha subunit
VVSRSGSLGTLLCLNLVQAGLGISAFVGIGGDPVIGTTTHDALKSLDNDAKTEAVALVGEIGGSMERKRPSMPGTMRKPVVAFIAGAASPPGQAHGACGRHRDGRQGQLRRQEEGARGRQA